MGLLGLFQGHSDTECVSVVINEATEQGGVTMIHQRTNSERITEEVTAWPGVEAGPGIRGEFSFKVNGREIGHLHGNHVAHFVFPKDLGTALRYQGRVGPHPISPRSAKLAARRIVTESDVRDVIELMRLNYDRIVALQNLPKAAPGTSSSLTEVAGNPS